MTGNYFYLSFAIYCEQPFMPSLFVSVWEPFKLDTEICDERGLGSRILEEVLQSFLILSD